MIEDCYIRKGAYKSQLSCNVLDAYWLVGDPWWYYEFEKIVRKKKADGQLANFVINVLGCREYSSTQFPQRDNTERKI